MNPRRALRDEPLTTAQLLARGVTEDALHRAVRRGEVRRLHHGVHVRADLVLTASLRLRAAPWPHRCGSSPATRRPPSSGTWT